MEIPLDVFNYFADEEFKLLVEDPEMMPVVERNSIILDQKQSQMIEAGILIAKFLLKVGKMRVIKDLNVIALQNLKNSLTPASKLYNWNTVCREVEKLGVTINGQMKAALVSGDHLQIVNLLKQIVEKDKQEQTKIQAREQRKNPMNETPLDIANIDGNKSLMDTQSTLEYIIVSLCQAMKLQPKQAAGMLTNHNQYLLHACIKGVKGKYDPILYWYQSLYQTSKHFTLLISDCFLARTQQSINQGFMLLNAIKSGFYSHHGNVVEWTFKLFIKIASDYEEDECLEQHIRWFFQLPSSNAQSLGGGLEGAIYGLQKNSSLVDSMALLINVTFKSDFGRLLDELKNKHCKSKSQYIAIINEVLPSLYKQNKAQVEKEIILDSGIIEECINYSESDQDTLLRAECLSLLTEIWLMNPKYIEDNTSKINDKSVLQMSLKVLKRGCRDSNRPLRLSALGLMFRLLDAFAGVRNPQAPVVYKQLTFSLIENCQDDITRDFMMTSFSDVFINHQTIPVGILTDPLLKILQNDDKQPFAYNVFDFDFFVDLAKHPKLPLAPQGIQLMDQMAKIYLSQPIWANCASVAFIILADRFQQDPNIQDFLLKFASITLTSMLQMKKIHDGLLGARNKINSAASSISEGPLATEDESTKKIRRNNIVQIIKKICNLKISNEFNEQIKELTLSTSRRHKQVFGSYNKGLIAILEIWHPKGKQAMEDYMKNKDIQEEKEKIAHDKANERKKRLQQKQPKHEQSSDQIEFYDGDEARRLSSIIPHQEVQALVPYINREPKNSFEKKAFQEIEAIKKPSSSLLDDVDEGQISALRNQGTLKDKPSEAQNIRLVNLDEEEEERDRDGVKIILQKYQKVFKFLFNKYAMSRAQHKKIQTFEYYGDKTINIAELNKILKDHDITQQQINKDQLTTLVRLLNQKIFKRNDLGALDFGGFLQFITQLAIFMYKKEDHLSPPEMIMNLINQFEKATRRRGQTTMLYEDPDISTVGDSDLMKEVNKRLKDNPDYPVPESFYKVSEKEQIFTYEVPEFVEIDEGQKIVIEVFDQFFFDTFKTHILEPIITYEQRIKVKPRIKNSNVVAPSGLSYMQPVDKKLKPLSGKETSRANLPPIEDQYKKPAVGVDLKLEMYQLIKEQPEDKNIIQETTDVLEEILQAVSQGLNKLPDRKVKGIKEYQNKYKETKLQKEEEEKLLKKAQEEKRLKRKAIVDQELEKAKKEKEEELKEQKKKKREDKKKQKEKEEKQKVQQAKVLEARKQQKDQTNKEKVEQDMKKKAEEDAKKLKEKEQKALKQKDFLKQQRKKFHSEFVKTKKEKEEAEKAVEEFEKWKEQKQKEVRQQMENYIKSNADTTKYEIKERKEINEFLNSQPVQDIFTQFKMPFDYMFKFYASQEKKKIGFDLEKNLQKMTFNEFIKFGFQTNITPSLIPNDDMVQIFRHVIRERRDSQTQKETDESGSGINLFNQEDFQRALVRIAILSNNTLNESKLATSINKPPKPMQSRARASSIMGNTNNSQSRQKLKRQNSAKDATDPKAQDTTRDNQDTKRGDKSQTRKTKEQLIIENIQKEKERYEKKFNVKIEDKRMSKPFDIASITPQKIEQLLRYIQLQTDDTRANLDHKFNKQRIEIQGQKPNKVKRELSPRKQLDDEVGGQNIDGGGEVELNRENEDGKEGEGDFQDNGEGQDNGGQPGEKNDKLEQKRPPELKDVSPQKGQQGKDPEQNISPKAKPTPAKNAAKK